MDDAFFFLKWFVIDCDIFSFLAAKGRDQQTYLTQCFHESVVESQLPIKSSTYCSLLPLKILVFTITN